MIVTFVVSVEIPEEQVKTAELIKALSDLEEVLAVEPYDYSLDDSYFEKE